MASCSLAERDDCTLSFPQTFSQACPGSGLQNGFQHCPACKKAELALLCTSMARCLKLILLLQACPLQLQAHRSSAARELGNSFHARAHGMSCSTCSNQCKPCCATLSLHFAGRCNSSSVRCNAAQNEDQTCRPSITMPRRHLLQQAMAATIGLGFLRCAAVVNVTLLPEPSLHVARWDGLLHVAEQVLHMLSEMHPLTSMQQAPS